jgi:hypothetical protein
MEHQAPDVLMHQAAALQDDTLAAVAAAAAAAAASGGVNGLLMHHTISTGGPEFAPHPAAAAAAGPSGVGAMGTWPQQSQSQSSSVGLDTSNMEQQANTHQMDQRQQSMRSSGANTGSNGSGRKQ